MLPTSSVSSSEASSSAGEPSSSYSPSESTASESSSESSLSSSSKMALSKLSKSEVSPPTFPAFAWISFVSGHSSSSVFSSSSLKPVRAAYSSWVMIEPGAEGVSSSLLSSESSAESSLAPVSAFSAWFTNSLSSSRIFVLSPESFESVEKGCSKTSANGSSAVPAFSANSFSTCSVAIFSEGRTESS